MYKKGTYILARVAGLLAFLILGCLLAVQTPYVQTKLTRAAVQKLSGKLDSHITYDELQVMASGVLQLTNVAIVDDNPYTEDINGRGWEPDDTLFRARSITATFSLGGLFKKEGLHMGRVTVEDGYMHLISEPDSLYQTNLQRIFRLPAPEGPAEPGGNIFDIRKVRVKNFRFRLNSFNPSPTGKEHVHGINFEDLDVTAHLVEGHSMRFSGGKMYAVCDRCSASEKSGYEIENITGRVTVGLGKTLVEDIHLIDSWSDAKIAYYSMNYAWGGEFKYYVEKVLMEAQFRRSKLALKTISYFSGIMKDSDALLNVRKGHFKGYVNDFTVSDLDFTDLATDVSATVNATVVGIPNAAGMMVDADIKGLDFTTAGLSHLASGIAGQKIDFSSYGKGERFTADISANGPVSRLTAKVSLSGRSSGSATVSADLRNLLTERPLELSAEVSTKSLDIGKIAGIGQIGECTLYTRAGAVLRKGGTAVRLDTLHVSQIQALGYTYNDIFAKGSLDDGTVNGSVSCSDPNLQFSLAGLVDLTPTDGVTRYKLLGDIPVANLHELKLDKRGTKSDISLGVYANSVYDGSVLRGDVILSDIVLDNDEGRHEFGDITLRAHPVGEQQSFRLSSAFVDASLLGSRSVVDFIEDIQQITSRRELPALYTEIPEREGCGTYELDVEFHDSRVLMGYLKPGVYIADGSYLRLNVDDNAALTGEFVSDRVAYSTNYLRTVDMVFDNLDGSLNANFNASELAAGKFRLDSPTMNAYASDDEVSLGVQYDNFSAVGGVGEIYVNGQFYRDQDGHLVIKAHPMDSYIQAGSSTWTFDESDIVLDNKDIYVSGFCIRSGDQYLAVDGGITKSRADTMAVSVGNLDLSVIDEFLPGEYGIKGTLSGKAYATSAPDTPMGMLLNFKADSLSIGGQDAGTITLSSMWSDEGRELGVYLLDRIGDQDALYASGSYFLKESRLDLTAYLDRFPLGIASPFLKDVFSSMGGTVSGKLRASGPTDDLSLQSENLFVSDAALKVAFTGVGYTVRGPLKLDDEGLHIEDMDIRDDGEGSAVFSGTLHHEHLKNFSLESQLNFMNLKVIDLSEKESKSFYGLLRASGNATLTGPMNALVIDGMVSTSGPGEVHIPVSSTLSGQTSDLLTFTEQKKVLDAYEQMLADNAVAKKTSSSDMRIRARVNVLSDVAAYVEIDKSSGNMISFNGTGGVNLNLRPSKNVFDFSGNYTISRGNYKFALPGVLSKDFDIESGSSAQFGGDILDTELDITAKYALKASLSSLITDSTTVSGRRDVNCGLKISNKLRNPELDFTIDIPDLDPTTKSQVEANLNTSDKIQKQFVALLVMGSFIPSETSGVFNGTNVLYSSVTSLMAGQINNILQKLEIPLDVDLNYQEGVTGRNIFDVAISTQLFNNRVEVGGSVGSRNYRTSSSNSEVVGDLDIAVKLDNEGKYRFNIFSHSADEHSSYIDNSQRNGIGFSFQKEFNSFKDFIRQTFTSRKARAKKAAERAAAGQKVPEREMVTIDIKEEDGR